MARAPSTKKVAPSWLATALDHVALCGDGPAHYAPFCLIAEGWCVGYDGIVAAGVRVQEDARVAPHTKTLRDAAKRAGSPYSLTALGRDQLVIRGNGVRVAAETLPLDQVPNVQPDRPIRPLTHAVRKVFADVSRVTPSRADRVFMSSLLLRDKTCVATNGTTILQGFHGNEIDGEWLLPREFAEAVGSAKWEPTAYGWSDATLTLWFGETAWLRCNLYQDKFPDTDVMIAGFMSGVSEWRPVPPALAVGVETLKPFLTEEGALTLHQPGLATTRDYSGASYSFEHFIPQPMTLNYAAWFHLSKHAQQVACGTDGVVWQGASMRGVSLYVPRTA